MLASIGAAARAALVVCALAACSSDGAEAQPGAPLSSGDAPEATSATTSSAATPQPATSQTVEAPVGYAKLPPPVSGDATLANLKALNEHRAKRWEQARAGFDEAVRLAPGYGIARFNLACARAKTGDLAGAAELLGTLLEEDMPQYAHRFANDPDLEAVRNAAEGERLRARVEALRPRWKDAAKGGLAAILWRGTEARSGSPITHFIRPGIYQHASRRFVPVGASPQKLAAAIVDQQGERVLLLTADLAIECTVDFCPRVYGYELEIGSLFGEPNPGPKRTSPSDGSIMLWGVTAQLTVGGFRFAESTAFAPAWRRVEKNGAMKPDSVADKSDRASLRLEASGSTLTRVEGGYALQGRALVSPSGERALLDAMHGTADDHTILVSPDRSTVYVLSSRSRCVCDRFEGSEFDYVLSRVDVASSKVELVSHQNGSAAIAFDAEGALYLQEGAKMRRWPKTLPRAEPEPVEEGVLLTTPDYGPTNCCGL